MAGQIIRYFVLNDIFNFVFGPQSAGNEKMMTLLKENRKRRN